MTPPSNGHRTAATTAFIYFGVSAVWILLSDIILLAFVDSIEELQEFQTYKGWFFVSVTAVLLYFALKVHLEKRKALENQLLRAQRMESLGRLAGGIAHDLNNILGPVLLGSEVLAKGAKDERSKKLLDVIRQSAERGRGLVRQILRVARGGEEGHPEISLKHVVKEVTELLSHTLAPGIVVQTNVPTSLWTLKADAGQLHQMLMNLAVNAGDAMSEGGTFAIEARNIDIADNSPVAQLASGPYVKIEVSDTGTGIPRENVNRIFEPFFTTKDAGKGTGLGLSIIQSIVMNHGGHIAVHSTEGKGTRFEIFLPAMKGSKAVVTQAAGARLITGNGERILIVDDEESIRNIMKEALENQGYHIELASDGAEALAILARDQIIIKVIITDLLMPVMDGPTLLKNLQSVGSTIPVIVTSGTHERSDARKSLEGLRYFATLEKPYSVDSLVRVIQSALSLIR